jgi:hypothetical protein
VKRRALDGGQQECGRFIVILKGFPACALITVSSAGVPSGLNSGAGHRAAQLSTFTSLHAFLAAA